MVCGSDFGIGRGAPHYLLRPETVESFFVLYQLTKDPIYREWGWEVFQSIERFCRTTYGYGALSDVHPRDTNTVTPRDSMESFFLAETLKYLYLLFDPDTPVDLLHKVSLFVSVVTMMMRMVMMNGEATCVTRILHLGIFLWNAF